MQNQSLLEYAQGRTDSRALQYQPAKKNFWEYRPFSRIVNWGRDFKECASYLKQKVLEAFGFVTYKTPEESLR